MFFAILRNPASELPSFFLIRLNLFFFNVIIYLYTDCLNMKNKIIAKDKQHLKKMIDDEIKLYGDNCDLNHIDTSLITEMSYLLSHSSFNGSINSWDVSKVKNMDGMFYFSQFNGNISNWNTSNVNSMNGMFYRSDFNQNISDWNVSHVTDMNTLFSHSRFNQDINIWDVSHVKCMKEIFYACIGDKPWWAIENNEKRQIAIDNFRLMQKLNTNLIHKDIIPSKKLKL